MFPLTTCACCQQPIENMPGHRPRQYCSDLCRKKASRRRRATTERALRQQQWQVLPAAVTARLKAIEQCYGEHAVQMATDAVIVCYADMLQALQVARALGQIKQS